MIHVQPDKQYQLRRACDRRHKAKLRCLRSSEEPCDRCQQVGAICTSSPVSRPQRHRSSSRHKSLLHKNASPKDSGRAAAWSETSLPMARGFFTQTIVDADRLDPVMGQVSPSDIHNISPTDFETLSGFQNQLDQFMLLVNHGLDTSFDLSPDIALSTNDLSPPQKILADTLQQVIAPPLSGNMDLTGTGASDGQGMITYASTSLSPMSTTTDSSSQNRGTPPTTPDKQDGEYTHPIEHSMRRMNDFNIALMRYLQVIPIIRPGDDAEELLAAPGVKCPVDEVFLLSEHFIQVTKSLRTSSSPNTYGSLSGSTSLDAASQMIVLSTYLRLIDTYSRILQHVLLHCQQRRDKPTSKGSLPGDAKRTAASQKSTLIEWSIGSFSLSSRSTIQQLFMLQLVETMLTQCRDVMDGITSEQAVGSPCEERDCFGTPSLSIVPDLAMQALRTREDATMHLVQQIKKYLSP